MSELNNPYLPPQPIETPPSFLTRLRWLLFGNPAYQVKREPDFVEGDALIYEGIAFFISLNGNDLIAASPSNDDSDARMALLIEETKRLLPSFLADYPQLLPLISDRSITVRMTTDYESCQIATIRETVLDELVSSYVDSDNLGFISR